MTTAITPSDPAALIESLDPKAISDRLAELERQCHALRVLLRTALARRREARRRIALTPPDGGANHAS
jgi:hypothetical protein